MKADGDFPLPFLIEFRKISCQEDTKITKII